MRSFETVETTSVQADRHGPSITTRSPDARTCANRSRNGPTSPPGLARMRSSADAGDANSAVSNAVAAKAFRIYAAPSKRCGVYLGKHKACGKFRVRGHHCEQPL